MANVSVYNIEGKEVGTIDLNDAVFGVEVNEHLVHMAVVSQLANKRQGTQKAKTRSEVSGGGRKPWRQKGTGHARQGSIRAPQWRHGGIVFAPKPRDYSYTVNKKVRRLALKSALSSKFVDDSIVVLDSISMDEYKTKTIANMLGAIGASKKALIVLPEMNEKIIKSSRNIEGVKTSQADNLNVYDILNANKLVIVKDSISKIEEVYA